MERLEEIRQNRIKKANFFKERGLNPYPVESKRTHKVAEALTSFNQLVADEKEIRLAGRIMAIRSHGKLLFVNFEDQSGLIQAFLSEDSLGIDDYNLFIDSFDLGDFVEFRGILFETKRGEKTIKVSDYKMLSKSVRPLPEKWHGLKSVEERYRKRYLDLIFNKEQKLAFEKRSQIIKELRNFLEKNDFLEVETPVLQPIYGGTAATPFITHHKSLDMQLYLRIAPELYLKRLLVAGWEKVFEFARCFRNEGIDKSHNPEFTLLEFYMAYCDYKEMMSFTEKMLQTVVKNVFEKEKINYKEEIIDFSEPFKRIEYSEIIKKETGLDINELNKEGLQKEAEKLGVEIPKGAKKAEICDELFKHKCREKLIQPTFVIHHPIGFQPLAKERDEKDNKLATFQTYIGGWEVLNAFSELNNPEEQRKRFKEQEEMKKEGFEEAQPMDEDFLEALEYGMPPAAGFGMGVDRLVAILTNSNSLREILLFPTMRKKKTTQMQMEITRKQALNLIKKYVKNENSIKHMLATEAVMIGLADYFNQDKQFWAMVGLLHDIDIEQVDYNQNPELHGKKSIEILQKEGIEDQELFNAILSHNKETKKERETLLEKAIYASDPVTGLIIASTLVLPDKKIKNLKTKSVLKRFKAKDFAKGADREAIASCSELGLSLEEFVSISLKAMQEIDNLLDL